MTIIKLVHCCIIVALIHTSIIKSFTPIKKHVTSAQAEAMKNINYEDVKREIRDLIEVNKPEKRGNLPADKYVNYWPPDYNTYAPLFIRLAWHASGTYRKSDGRGGADGGRQRLEPERSWPDNTNLDKARWLLIDIKSMYGQGLSWGDLIVLAGNAAIESLGGPQINEFCGGRIDDDGAESMWLGPSEKQEKYFPCRVDENDLNITNGACKAPLGVTTVGLIYVNPEGPLNLETGMNDPDPTKSVAEIRRTFSAMGMDDRETVALIGGGHTIGKCHGACKDGPGKPPNENPTNPWKGPCGDGELKGKLENTYTSGFEFPWVTNPDVWSNEYFKNLLNFKDNWELKIPKDLPGDKHGWHLNANTADRDKFKAKNPNPAKVEDSDRQDIGMLTTDIALLRDDSYLKYVAEFSEKNDEFNRAFEDAWYKLTTRDMGPRSRCINSETLTPQEWQHTPDFNESPATLSDDDQDSIMPILIDEGFKGQFARLAWQCMATFRSSDYQGGCNGAILTTDDEMTKKTKSRLMKFKDEETGSKISLADLIILAGNIDIKELGGNKMDMCYGRTDISGSAEERYRESLESNQRNQILSIRANLNEDPQERKNEAHNLENFIDLMGLTLEEYAAIHGAGYSIGPGKNPDEDKCTGLFCFRHKTGDSRPLAGDMSAKISNAFFKHITDTKHFWGNDDLIKNDTDCHPSQNDSSLCMYDVDFQFLDSRNTKLYVIAERYAADEELFKENLANAWTKLASADMFDGPFKHRCDKEIEVTTTPDSSKTDQPVTSAVQPATQSDQEDKNCTCPPVPCGSDSIKSIKIVINIALMAIALVYYY